MLAQVGSLKLNNIEGRESQEISIGKTQLVSKLKRTATVLWFMLDQ